MEIKLKKEEKIIIDYDGCPRCHSPFNKKKKKKTQNHAIPMFMKPKTEVIHNLCEECHNELNSFYKGSQIVAIKSQVISKDWEEFEQNYHLLRANYYDKKINRGQFGEGLWSNLISYLESIENKKNKGVTQKK